MKKLLLYLLCALSCNLDSMNLDSLSQGKRISGAVIAEHFAPGRQLQINLDAEARLQDLLDHQDRGFRAKLQKVILEPIDSVSKKEPSVKEVQEQIRLKRRDFAACCEISRKDVEHNVVVVLKDYTGDANSAIYERYLAQEYARAIDEKARDALGVLDGIYQSQLDQALRREKAQAKAKSRPFRIGISLFTNVAKDAREDFPQAAAAVGVCAVVLPYIPIKTREKLEEGLGSAIVTYPGSAATSLGLLFAGWQTIKYGMRYFSYKQEVSQLESQIKSNQDLFYVDVKEPFVAQVPFILQSARESATIARLEHQVQSLAVNSAIAQQLLEQQAVSLQSLETFARAHGVSFQDVIRKLDKVGAGQVTLAAGFGLLQKQGVDQRKQLQDVSDNVQDVKSDMEEIKEMLKAGHPSREHRSASDAGCAALLVQPQAACNKSTSAFFAQHFGIITSQPTQTASAKNLSGLQSAFSSRVLSSQGAPVVPKQSVELQ